MSLLRFCNFSHLSYLLALILVLPLVACSSGGDDGSSVSSYRLSWVAPSEREDGTGLSLSEIEGFRIYYGSESDGYSNTVDIDKDATQAVIDGVPSGAYYVVMTTVDTEGRESSFSAPEFLE